MRMFILLLWLMAFFGGRLFSQLPPLNVWHVLAMTVIALYGLFALLCVYNARRYPHRLALGEDA